MIFITGGTGLVGSHLLVELTQQHDKVTAIYRNKEKIQTVNKVFNHYLKKNAKDLFSKINWVYCDIMDVPNLDELIANHKIVYHCAAIVSFKRKDFSKMMQVNREGTANIVNLCLHHKIDKLCYVSSTAAVGNKDILEDELVDENGKWILTNETSGYSISKYSAEKEVWRGSEEGLNVVIVNPSIIIGAGNWQESSLVIFKTINKGLKFYASGANAFVDARDVAKIMVELVNKNVINERFLCVGANTSFKTLFDLIALKMGKKPPRYKVAPFFMEIAWRVAVLWAYITFSTPVLTKSSARNAFKTIKFSNSKIKNILGYEFSSLEDSVVNSIEGRVK